MVLPEALSSSVAQRAVARASRPCMGRMPMPRHVYKPPVLEQLRSACSR